MRATEICDPSTARCDDLPRPDGRDTSLASFLVERLRGHVKSVRPDDRPKLTVDVDLGEDSGIPEWLEHPEPLVVVESDVANRSVLEREPQLVITDHFDLGDVHEWRYLDHAQILGERLDRLERFMLARTFPVGEQFVPMQPGPLAHQPQLATR